MALIRKKYEGQYLLFITNRYLRLWPTYFIVLILTVAAWICLPTILPSYMTLASAWNRPPASATTIAVLVASNATLVGQDALMFTSIDRYTGNFNAAHTPGSRETWYYLLVPQSWSVSLELLFYLVAPFITRMKVVPLIALILVSFGARAVCISFGLINDPWDYRFFPSELYCFVFGILANRMYENQRQAPPSKNLDLSIAVLLFMLIGVCEYLPLSYKNYIIPSVLGLALPSIFRCTENNSIDRFVGELSYPVYIVHLLVMSLVAPVVGHSNVYLYPLGSMLFSIVAATVLYFKVDRPIDAWRQRRAKIKICKE